jgi:hypothetical protein
VCGVTEDELIDAARALWDALEEPSEFEAALLSVREATGKINEALSEIIDTLGSAIIE